MPLISIPDTKLRDSLIDYKDQLKCRNKSGNTIDLLDVARVDLFSIIGIRRQLNLLNQDIESPDFQPITMTKLEGDLSISSASISSPEEINFSELITNEFIANVLHYFSSKIRIKLEKEHVIVDSDEPFLTAALLRVIISDLFDEQPLSQVNIETSDEVMRNVNEYPKPLVLTRSSIGNLLGIELEDDDIIKALKSYGYTDIRLLDSTILVNSPFFRIDVTSSSDVLEDIFNFFISKIRSNSTLLLPKHKSDLEPDGTKDLELKNRFTLQGYKEVRLPNLLSCRKISDPLSIGISANDKRGNPSLAFRQSLFHSLIAYEKGRQHIRLPHRIFEVGSVSKKEGFYMNLALMVVDQGLDINDLYFGLHHSIGVTYNQEISLSHGSDDRFDSGGFEILSPDGLAIGVLGVISKDVAKKYKQRLKTGFAELSLPTKLL